MNKVKFKKQNTKINVLLHLYKHLELLAFHILKSDENNLFKLFNYIKKM